MATDQKRIFLGNTPGEQRKFITDALRRLAPKRPKLVIPCVGQFTLVKCATAAGYKPEDIRTSDISLFSRVLGAIYSGEPLSEVPFTLSPELAKAYKALSRKKATDNDIDRAAFLVAAMKFAQLEGTTKPGNYFMQVYVDEIQHGFEKYRERLAASLRSIVPRYEGITYEHMDLREVFDREPLGEDTVVVFNPPAFARGYEKMFDFGEHIGYDPEVEEFSWDQEYPVLFGRSLALDALALWYRYKTNAGYEEFTVYGCEYTPERVDYWLCTKPDELGYEHLPILTAKKRSKVRKFRAPITPPDYRITEDTRVTFREVDAEVGLYYRDLFAHKMGSTGARQHILCLLDGYVFGVVGMLPDAVLTLKSEHVFEVYGFNAPLDAHPKANRLLMSLITNAEFGQWLHMLISRRNRLYKLSGLRTACISKYRKVKLNNGVLDLESREKLPNGSYHLMYQTDWHQKSHSECVAEFLQYEKEKA